MSEVRANYLIEISTPTPRRLTSYRGRVANGQRGLDYGGEYYKAAIVDMPGIEETDSVAPVRFTLSLGNADHTLSDLYTNSANFRAEIIIRKLKFSGTWDEAFPPTVDSAAVWFEGFTATPSLRGERLLLECHADLGRRGTSPATKSRTLLVDHACLTNGQKLPITVRTT